MNHPSAKAAVAIRTKCLPAQLRDRERERENADCSCSEVAAACRRPTSTGGAMRSDKKQSHQGNKILSAHCSCLGFCLIAHLVWTDCKSTTIISKSGMSLSQHFFLFTLVTHNKVICTQDHLKRKRWEKTTILSFTVLQQPWTLVCPTETNEMLASRDIMKPINQLPLSFLELLFYSKVFHVIVNIVLLFNTEIN